MLIFYHRRIITLKHLRCKRIHIGFLRFLFLKTANHNIDTKNGACTEQISTSPEVIYLPISVRQKLYLPLRRISLPIQPDIVKVHLTGTARGCYIAFRAETDSDFVNICQINTLIGKGL